MRTVLRALGVVISAALVLPGAAAQESRLVRLVTPAPPGGNLDTTARALVHRLAALTNDTWLVDNKPGGNTVIGMDHVVRAAPDGRVLLYHATSVVILPALQKLPFSALDDLVPVIHVSNEHYAVVVPSASTATSLRDLEELAAARPGGLNCIANPGVSNLACEQFRARVGGRATLIPYAGVAPAMQAIVGGHGDVMFASLDLSMKLAEANRLRIIAVSSRQARLPAAHARMPLVQDTWPGFVLEGFSGVYAPAGTPPARIRELSRDLQRVMADPQLRQVMQEAGQEPVGGTPEEFSAVVRRGARRYAELAQKLNLAPP